MADAILILFVMRRLLMVQWCQSCNSCERQRFETRNDKLEFRNFISLLIDYNNVHLLFITLMYMEVNHLVHIFTTFLSTAEAFLMRHNDFSPLHPDGQKALFSCF